MKIAVGSDHSGFEHRQQIIKHPLSGGHEVRDFGTYDNTPTDYPLFIRPVAEAVAAGEYERGIVLGASGNGEAIVANRIKGIRCAVCWDVKSALLCRQHNDANMVSLG